MHSSRKCSVLVVVAAICAAFPAASSAPAAPTNQAPAAPASAPVSKIGSFSTVHLVEAKRVAADEARREGASGGLRLMFLVVRSASASGPFTLSELRDVTLGTKSYSATTLETMGRRFEPHTSIEEPRNVRLGARNVGEIFELGGTTAVVMVTTLYGAALPQKGEGALTLKVGWDKQLEEFGFRFDLARLP